MATIALQDGKVILIDGKISCICCGDACVTGDDYYNYGRPPDADPSGPCTGFYTVNSTAVTAAGLYDCNGTSDDGCTVTWSGGSKDFPASQPEIGPCYGITAWSLSSITLEAGEKVKCEARSWAGPCGCSFSCCLITAP